MIIHFLTFCINGGFKIILQNINHLTKFFIPGTHRLKHIVKSQPGIDEFGHIIYRQLNFQGWLMLGPKIFQVHVSKNDEIVTKHIKKS